MDKIRIIIVVFFLALTAFGQSMSFKKYEVEILENRGLGKRDTREVNSILIFEKDSLIVKSRRNSKVFKTFEYSKIKSVEHLFLSGRPSIDDSDASIISTFFSDFRILVFERKSSHWLSMTTEDDFAVLKLENDNFKLITLEFKIRKFKLDRLVDNKPI
jgi:hypothetical protein